MCYKCALRLSLLARRSTTPMVAHVTKVRMYSTEQPFRHFLPKEDRTGKTVKAIAAVAYTPGGADHLMVEEVEVAPPKAHEVRLKMIATSVCHTDVNQLLGRQPVEGKFPSIFGHEGIGIVESIGEGVTSCRRGDLVFPLWIPQCRTCKCCLNPKTNMCLLERTTKGGGLMHDGTVRFRAKDGTPLHHYMGTSTFSEYTVLDDASVAVINEEARGIDDPAKLAVLGCGFTTGYGSSVKTAGVERGSTVAVWGLGCVGLGAVCGAANAGASKVIAIDINEQKHARALRVGATECVNPERVPGGISLNEYLTKRATEGGVDYTLECVGSTQLCRDALECAHRDYGTSVVVGVPGAGKEIQAPAVWLLTGRSWKGALFGSMKSRDDLPKLVERVRDGRIPVDEFITARLPFRQIRKAWDLMLDPAGNSIRTLLTY